MAEDVTQPANSLGIATPEQVVLDFPIAGLGSRCLALALDTLFLFVLTMLTFVIAVPAAAFSAHGPSATANWILAIWVILSFLITWGYFSAFEVVWRGQTPGKRLAHLRVISATGHPATVGQILARNLVRIVDALPGVYSVGMVCMLLSRRSQRLGDLAAGTVVVHETQAALPPPVADAPPAAVAAVASLTAADLQLLESYLLRRDTLPEETRLQMAERIHSHLAPRLTAEGQALAGTSEGLESLAAALRASLRYSDSV